jgi:hypothetical protein
MRADFENSLETEPQITQKLSEFPTPEKLTEEALC